MIIIFYFFLDALQCYGFRNDIWPRFHCGLEYVLYIPRKEGKTSLSKMSVPSMTLNCIWCWLLVLLWLIIITFEVSPNHSGLSFWISSIHQIDQFETYRIRLSIWLGLLLCRELRPPQKNECPRYDTIWWWGSSNPETFGNAEYPFIAIAPGSTLARSGCAW